MSAILELTDDGFVRWQDWPLKTNPKANKQWAALVSGYDPDTKYNWQQEFLSRDERDGDLYHDFTSVTNGDVVRVDAGSHNNDQTSCFLVNRKDSDEMEVEQIADENAIEIVSDDDQAYRRELIGDITEALQGADTDDLEEIHEWMTGDPDDPLTTTHHPLQRAMVAPGSQAEGNSADSDEWPDWMENI